MNRFLDPSIDGLLARNGVPAGKLSERIEWLESRLKERSSVLESLVESEEFLLGDALLGLVSRRKLPRVPEPVAKNLMDEDKVRLLLLKIEELERLIHKVRGGLRISVGRHINSLIRNPWRIDVAMNTCMELSAALVRRFIDELEKGIRSFSITSFAGINGPPDRWLCDEPARRILLYAQVNPNLIDGATTWLASIANTLVMDPEVRLTVLLSAELRRVQMLGQLLHHPQILWLQPLGTEGVLSPMRAMAVLWKLDRICKQDVVILRGPGPVAGFHILEAASLVPSMASRTYGYLVDPACWRSKWLSYRLAWVRKRLAGLVLQTPEAKTFVQELLKNRASDSLFVLPPMIPEVVSSPHVLKSHRPPRLVYAGKFSPPYMVLEMIMALDEIRKRFPGAEFHVVGDKFHNRPRQHQFEKRLREALDRPGVVWHGGCSRQKTREIISGCDVALSWRDHTFDRSMEMATKVLEYAGQGLAVIMNPTDMHRRLFGDDYPGFVNDQSEYVPKVCSLLQDVGLYEQAARRALEVASGFTFREAAKALQEVIFQSDQTSR